MAFEPGLFANHLGYRLRRLDLSLMARLSEALAEYGLTAARATALTVIVEHGCGQADLGRCLGTSRASTMKLVNALVALGLVERGAGPDRRSNSLAPTAHGHTTWQAVVRIIEALELDNFSVLTAAEQAELGRLLDKLRAAHGIDSEFLPQPRLRAVNNDN
jgi:DNA-binding MarR family transcriptional regulator